MQRQSDTLTYCRKKKKLSISLSFKCDTRPIKPAGIRPQDFSVSWPLDPYGVVSVFRSIRNTHSEGPTYTHTRTHTYTTTHTDSLRCHITQYAYVNVTFISSYLQLSKCNFQHC